MNRDTILAAPARFPRLLLPAGGTGPATDLAAAVEAGAFSALRKAVEELKPQGVLAAVAGSGMLGRGGSGLTLGDKWAACAHAGAAGDQRYVVVNAYQSDPAVQTDRVLLETSPFAVLEGAAIAAFAVGATDVLIAVRLEAANAVRTMGAAIQAAEKAGYLGEGIFGSTVDIRVSVKPVQGSYMLGEETVLLKGLEGMRGQPEQQPPYTTERGLFGKPTLVHGPQTLASVPTIVNGGMEGFEWTGPRAFAGTVLVQISGAVVRPGIAEVPFGATLGEIVDIAGGLPPSHKLKALLVGGPSGGILPPEALTLAYDHENLEKAGAHIGSGSVVVVDQHSCVVDLAAVLTRFCADEACGKTIPCRIGLRRLAEIGSRICEGQPRGDEVTRLSDLAHDVAASALCAHERRATLALTSLVRYFRDELDAHILRNSCPAGICHPKADARAGATS